ncbi:MAG: FkbM family methyltransferase [Cyclobacteriaceae bacterium]
MIKYVFKRGVKRLLSLGGYQITNKNLFGIDILVDIKTILSPSKKLVVFDVGANLGQTSSELSGTFPISEIYSFEPDPMTYADLVLQTKAFPEVKTFNIGFGHKKGRVQLNINKNSGGNSILSMSDRINDLAFGEWTECIGTQEIEITTLNLFCQEKNIKHIDLVKLDTQGYEHRILEGGDRVIIPSFTKVVYIEVLFAELYQDQSYFQDIYKILTERGFKLVGLYNKFHKIEPPHYLLWCDALFVSSSL